MPKLAIDLCFDEIRRRRSLDSHMICAIARIQAGFRIFTGRHFSFSPFVTAVAALPASSAAAVKIESFLPTLQARKFC